MRLGTGGELTQQSADCLGVPSIYNSVFKTGAGSALENCCWKLSRETELHYAGSVTGKIPNVLKELQSSSEVFSNTAMPAMNLWLLHPHQCA